MSEWTDELKQQVIDEYQAAEPTPENSTEIVKDLAEKYEKTVNGIRMILTRADVYVKKVAPAATSAAKGGAKSGGTARVSKADAIAELTKAIEASGQDADEEILSKLTGKAAVYFTGIVTALNK